MSDDNSLTDPCTLQHRLGEMDHCSLGIVFCPFGSSKEGCVPHMRYLKEVEYRRRKAAITKGEQHLVDVPEDRAKQPKLVEKDDYSRYFGS